MEWYRNKMKKSDKLVIVDRLASEYKWTVEYIMALPTDVLFGLYRTITDRKLEEQATLAKIIGIATACAFNGKLKKLDKIFKRKGKGKEEEIDPMVQKEQMRAMWMAMKKDPKEFERQYAKGEVTF